MSDKTLKIAVMSFAHHHVNAYIPAMLSDDGIEILTCDQTWDGTGDGLRGRPFAEHYGVPYVDTYDELLAWGPDAVLVCSENGRHKSDVLRSLNAGAHVMCEKPLATSVADATEMADTAEQSDLVLMTAYPIRFMPAFQALERTVREGKIGEIVGASGTNNGKLPGGWFIDPDLAGGGALMDLTVHVADLMDCLLNADPARTVYAASNRILHGFNPDVQVETGGLVTVTYEGGVVLTIDCSWSEPEGSPSWGGLTLEVIGTQGTVEMDAFGMRVGGFEEQAGADFWLDYVPNVAVPMLNEFLTAVREGRPAIPSGRDGVRSVVVAEASGRSAADGEPVLVSS